MIDDKHCRSESLALRETNDCVVRALAVATQIDYRAMREYLADYGRKPRSGMFNEDWRRALADLGVSLTRLEGPRYEYGSTVVEGTWVYNPRTGREHYRAPAWRTVRRIVPGSGVDYQAATVATLARELTEGTYLVSIAHHVLCLRDGVVYDFTKGRRHKIRTVWRVDPRHTGG